MKTNKTIDLGKLQDVSLNERAKEEERTVKLQIFVSDTTKKQLDLIKIMDKRKYKDILTEIVENKVSEMAESKGIKIDGDEIAIKK